MDNKLVFGKKYSDIYNILYKKKNYKKEARYISKIIKNFNKKSTNASILDLGCGTGIHAIELNKLGYNVTGLDQSAHMISIAKKLNHNNENFFINKNITKFKYINKFDAVISMFAVIGYLTSNVDLLSTFKNSYNSLNKNGVFSFDCWNGSAVLSEKPMNKTFKTSENNINIIRSTKQKILHEKNVVQIILYG